MLAVVTQDEGRAGCKIGLWIPRYLAVIQYADNCDLCKQIYHAYAIHASEFPDDDKFDNTASIDRILKDTL